MTLIAQIFKSTVMVLVAAGSLTPGFASTAAAADLAPAMTALTSEGLKQQMLKSPHRAVVVNLWATWCEPCRAEMPQLLQFRKEHLADDVQVLLLSANTPEEKQEASDFLKKMGVDFSTNILGEAPDDFMKPFVTGWPAAVPTTIVFGRDGKRLAYYLGALDFKALREAVKSGAAGHPGAKASEKGKTP